MIAPPLPHRTKRVRTEQVRSVHHTGRFQTHRQRRPKTNTYDQIARAYFLKWQFRISETTKLQGGPQSIEGGRVWASRNSGSGTTFNFTLEGWPPLPA